MDISGIGGETCNSGEAKKVTFNYVGRPLTQLGNNASVRWAFGEGGVLSNLPNVSHTYNNYGTKTVELIRFDGVCSDTLTRQITINPPNSADANFVKLPDITICEGESVTLKAHGVQYDYNLYSWISCSNVNWGLTCNDIVIEQSITDLPCLNPPYYSSYISSRLPSS